MTYAQAIEHLNQLGPELPQSPADGPRHKFDLAHMRALCDALGNPQQRFPSVLIAGTNGKGSTAATLASILTAAGYRTGLYTSPHLVRVNERIRLAHPVLPSEYGSASVIGSEGPLALSDIADEDFARLYTLVDDASERLVASGDLPWSPSFFERLTALAFSYYAGTDTAEGMSRAEIVVLEVGIGGRLDATNVVEPLLSVITDIALDHQNYLGDTLAEIAAEKAGIVRQDGTLVTLSQHPEANQAIGNAAAQLNVRGVNAGAYLPQARRNQTPLIADEKWNDALRNRYSLSLDDDFERGTIEVDSPLAGEHQRRNVALAIAAAIDLRNTRGYKLSNAAIEAGIAKTVWPGRLEWIAPNLLLDVAHNPAGAWTLRAAIGALPENLPRTLLFSCLRDKDLSEMSRILFPLFDSASDGDPARRGDHIVLAPIPNARAASVESLLAAAHLLGIPAHASAHLAGALAQAREVTPANGIIIATGSVYLVGAIRQLALGSGEVSD